MSTKLAKVIVIHPDRQHSLQTAFVLQKEGLLYKYFTTVYLKKYSLSSFFATLVPGNIKKKFLKHKLEGLDDSKVHMFCQKRMLFLSLVSHFLSEETISKFRLRIIRAFNNKCLAYCLRNKFDVLISYDTLSGSAFKELKNQGVKLILDMSAPCFKEMHHNFQLDVSRHRDDSKVLELFLESKKAKMNLEKCQEELNTYDYFLVASTYTRDTLVKNNIDESKILVAPYGLTHNVCPQKKEHEGFSCTFVGSVTQQKGCHYIFRIAEKMPHITFNLVGAYDNSYSNVPTNCKLYGYLAFKEIENVLQKTDLFLFLSLADGFGFAATEAMSYGIPVVCSKYAGVRDLVQGNGWIVDPADVKTISDIITWCINNPDETKQLGLEARKVVLAANWATYSSLLTSFIKRI